MKFYFGIPTTIDLLHVVFILIDVILLVMITQLLKRLKHPIQLRRPVIPVSKADESRSESFEVSKINKVRRLPERASYDRVLVHSILDAAVFVNVCYVDVIDNENYYLADSFAYSKEVPKVIPMLFGREGDTILLHGHVSCGLNKKLAQKGKICLSVTHLDGLVYARSLFHSSANYRSVCLYGTAETVVDEKARMDALRTIVACTMPDRWNDARYPNEVEMKSTGVLRFHIEQASAKVRDKDVGDDDDDIKNMTNWAGILPLYTVAGEPISAGYLSAKIRAPNYIRTHPKFTQLQERRVRNHTK